MVSSKSKWEVFFQGAGIPSRQSSEYAQTFADNRMRLDMLGEISKQVLHDLGIKALGDVIAILRYAKRKHVELNRSPSPDVQISAAIAPPAPIKFKTFEKSVICRPAKSTNVNKSANLASTSGKSTSTHKANLLKNKQTTATTTTTITKPINITKEKIRVTTNSVKSGEVKKLSSTSTRLTLSQRFDEFETEAKRKRVEDVNPSVQAEKSKGKATLFTIQLPSKQPPAAAAAAAAAATKPKPKVTVVPAQGKALNRNNKATSSIFDRLDAQSSSSTAMSLLANQQSHEKQNVFKRLGSKSNNNEQKVQVVPPMKGAEHPAKSVFNRLGDR